MDEEHLRDFQASLALLGLIMRGTPMDDAADLAYEYADRMAKAKHSDADGIASIRPKRRRKEESDD